MGDTINTLIMSIQREILFGFLIVFIRYIPRIWF